MKAVLKDICITTAPLSIPKEEMFECAMHDRGLINHICQFRKHLEAQDIEIFSRHENILVTETGYYCAMYLEDIREVEGGIDNPTPFIGRDGRMKVEVIKENGDMEVVDLAKIVAMSYCENPNHYTKVFFRDFDKTNCNADNLYYVSRVRYILLNLLSKLRLWSVFIK